MDSHCFYEHEKRQSSAVNDPILEKRGIMARVHQASYRFLFFWVLSAKMGTKIVREENFILSIMILLFLFPATITISLMNTNSSATLRTSPSGFFIANKFSYTVFLNIFKIFNLAHIVFSSVSFIQMF